MKINKWRIFQVVQFALFLAVSVFLFLRKVDGSGAENTAEVQWISFAIWLGFYLFILILEYGVRFLIAILNRWDRHEKIIFKILFN